ncbi:hypothetical protein MHU86_24834 [Fragilaria crotonensis]|nr:hypothetical protein MHU86_24834 [Fragilaria crotonensis]
MLNSGFKSFALLISAAPSELIKVNQPPADPVHTPRLPSYSYNTMRIHALGLLALTLSFAEPSWGFVASSSLCRPNAAISPSTSLVFVATNIEDDEPITTGPVAVVDAVDSLPEFIAMEDTNYPNLQEQTDPFLDPTMYPLGSLPASFATGALLVMNAWARTASPTGAWTAAAILERLEREVEAGNTDIGAFCRSCITVSWRTPGPSQIIIRQDYKLSKFWILSWNDLKLIRR